MESIIERSAGLGFWIVASGLIYIVSEKYNRRSKIIIYSTVLVITLIIIYKIEQRREQRKADRAKEKDNLLERCMKYVARGNWPDHEHEE